MANPGQPAKRELAGRGRKGTYIFFFWVFFLVILVFPYLSSHASSPLSPQLTTAPSSWQCRSGLETSFIGCGSCNERICLFYPTCMCMIVAQPPTRELIDRHVIAHWLTRASTCLFCSAWRKVSRRCRTLAGTLHGGKRPCGTTGPTPTTGVATSMTNTHNNDTNTNTTTAAPMTATATAATSAAKKSCPRTALMVCLLCPPPTCPSPRPFPRTVRATATAAASAGKSSCTRTTAMMELRCPPPPTRPSPRRALLTLHTAPSAPRRRPRPPTRPSRWRHRVHPASYRQCTRPMTRRRSSPASIRFFGIQRRSPRINQPPPSLLRLRTCSPF